MVAYYEIHMILSGLNEQSSDAMARHRKFVELVKVCQDNGFWASMISKDTGNEEDAGDVIVTTREPRRETATQRIIEFAEELKEKGYSVSRYKVETCDLDSQIEDELELLNRA